MAVITQEIKVEVARKNLFQALVSKQSDYNSRFLKVTLCDSGVPITIDPASTVTINANRPDGMCKRFEGVSNDDDTVTVPLAAWMLELPGMVYCDISVTRPDTSKLTSTSFSIDVEPAAASDDEISKNEEYDILVQLVEEFENISSALSNTMTGSASGAFIKMSDVSPIEHDLKVKMEAPNGVELPKLMVSGKNLFDPYWLTENDYAVKQEDGSLYIARPEYRYKKIYEANGRNLQVSMSFGIKTQYAPVSNGFQFVAVYETGNNSYIGKNSQGEFFQVEWKSDSKRKLLYIEADAGTRDNPTWLRDIQLEFGGENTPYEPYVSSEYIPNSDGTVDGVKSISPTMVLKTDMESVKIDVEYNRDINKAYDAVVNAIKTLGGSVESFVTEIAVAAKVFTIHIGSYESDLKADVSLHINGEEVYRSDGLHDVETFQYDTMPATASITLHSGSVGYARVGSSWEDYTEIFSDDITTLDLLSLGYTEIYISNSY